MKKKGNTNTMMEWGRLLLFVLLLFGSVYTKPTGKKGKDGGKLVVVEVLHTVYVHSCAK